MLNNSIIAKQICFAIQKALIDGWDPIGVRDIPEAQDEYNSYVPMLYDLLVLNKSDQEIFNYLWWAETEHMGLEGQKNKTENFVKKLRFIYQINNEQLIFKKNIKIKWSDLQLLGNVLNEVCHGIYLENIENETGFKKDSIFALLIKIAVSEPIESEKEKMLIIELENFEIEILKRCFPIVERELKGEEFQKRIGLQKEQTYQILNKLINHKEEFKNSS
jgi:hypothetical protein